MKNTKKVKIEFTPSTFNKKNELIKDWFFSKQPQGIESLQTISKDSRLILMHLITNENKSNMVGVVNKFTQLSIYKPLGIKHETYKKCIDELIKKEYIIIDDEQYIIKMNNLQEDLIKNNKTMYEEYFRSPESSMKNELNEKLYQAIDDEDFELVKKIKKQIEELDEPKEENTSKSNEELEQQFNNSDDDLIEDVAEIGSEMAQISPQTDEKGIDTSEEKKVVKSPENKSKDYIFNFTQKQINELTIDELETDLYYIPLKINQFMDEIQTSNDDNEIKKINLNIEKLNGIGSDLRARINSYKPKSPEKVIE